MSTPDAVPSRVKLPSTVSTNGPIVHPNDATAYEMPKTNIDQNVRERPPRSSRGVAKASDRPMRKATPTAMSTNPMTMLR